MSRISNSTVRRLSIYLRQLESVREEGRENVLSAELAERSAVKATQMRKDLSFFGSFGRRGIGYSVPALIEQIRLILGLDRVWSAVLFGAGSLGHALAGYHGFEPHNIRITAIADVDPGRIGKTISGITVENAADAAAIRARTNAQIAVLAVPATAAQDLADKVVAAGFSGIVNFAPVRLILPASIALYSVDLAVAFEQVTYKLKDLKPPVPSPKS